MYSRRWTKCAENSQGPEVTQLQLKSVIASENALKIWDSSLTCHADSSFYASLRHAIKSAKFPWLEDIIAAESSVTVFFNFFAVDHRFVRHSVEQHLGSVSLREIQNVHELITLPVVYGGETGMDLTDVAKRCHLTVEEVVQLHQDTLFTVTAVGFAPGFGYLKGLPESLILPRRDDPRTSVPKGAVAIAENYTAIYPESSPGGWHLIGYCPEPLFDVNLPVPALFKVGQQIKFVALT